MSACAVDQAPDALRRVWLLEDHNQIFPFAVFPHASRPATQAAGVSLRKPVCFALYTPFYIRREAE